MLVEPDSAIYRTEETNSVYMLLITSELGYLIVDCILTNTSDEPVRGIFGVYSHLDVFVPNGRVDITVPPKSSVTVSLELVLRDKVYHTLAERRIDSWEFYFNEESMYFCETYTYLLDKMPILPWETHVGEEYRAECQKYPSLYFIKSFITIYEVKVITTADEVILRSYLKQQFMQLLNSIYEGQFLVHDEITHYVKNYNLFDLSNFLRDIGNWPVAQVSSTDCANIVSLIAAILGIQLKMNVVIGYGNNDFGAICNEVIPIPSVMWQEYHFTTHQVAFYSERDRFDNDAEIYDLSLKIDRGSYPDAPHENNNEKIPFLSGGLLACQTVNGHIHITHPYDDAVYLERLVRTEQTAFFGYASMSAEIYSPDNIGEQPNELYSEIMQKYIQFYGLDNEKYAVEMSQPEMKLSLLQKMNLEKRSEGQYECEWSAPHGMRVKWFRNAEHLPAGEYLASVLMRFSCPLVEKEAPELGERVFYGPDLLIAYSGGSAYLIECKEMGKAEEMAHNLKSSMIQ